MFTSFKTIPCLAAALLLAASSVHAQTGSLHDPTLGMPYDAFDAFGSATTVSGRTALVSAPDFDPTSNEDAPYDGTPYSGVVYVYTTDASRTAWTLAGSLHAEDAAEENRYFGAAISLRGRRLIVATYSTIRIYEKEHGTFELRDKVALSGENVVDAAAMAYANGVLAVKTQAATGNNEQIVHVYRVNERGKAHQTAVIHAPNDPMHFGWYDGPLGLEADGSTLAIGRPQHGTEGPVGVYFYEPHGNTWVLKAKLSMPNAAATSFGSSLSLRHGKLIVGAPTEGLVYDPEGNTDSNSGAVYVYRRLHEHWKLAQRIDTVDPSQPTLGLHKLGSAVATNGKFFWITAPSTGDHIASNIEHGPALVYRWHDGQLELVSQAFSVYPDGGLDISRRYVVQGAISLQIFQSGAEVVDLFELMQPNSVDALDDDEDTAAVD